MKTKSRSPDNVDECEADNMTEDSDKDLKKSSNNEINAEISKQNYIFPSVLPNSGPS